MKEFNDVLERNHPDDDTVVRYVQLLGDRGWLVQYDVGAEMEPWVMNVVAGLCKWAHPVDYDVTRIASLIPKSGPLGEVLGAAENVVSCEPGPDMRQPLWDKTQGTWHTDVDKVGRYSVQRPGKRMPYQAYLNGKDLGLMPDADPEVLKRSVNRRILEARRINHLTDNMPFQSPVGAGEKANT